MKIYHNRLAQSAILGSLFAAPNLLGAGFQLAERSASGLGRAFSGEASIADDASVVSSNPAAMLMLGGDWNFSVGGGYINPGADATLYPAVTGGNAGPVLKDDDIAESAFVPYLYLTKRMSEDIAVGLGVYSNYGLRTNYSDSVADLVGTNYSDITTINFSPSIAYRINEMISIGAGLDVVYAEGELTANAVAGTPAPSFKLKGDDLAFGYNLGILLNLSESTRVGINYRSKVELALDGSASGSPFGGASVPGELDVDLPASAEVSIFHQLNDKWAVHGDILWTQWSSFDTLEPMVSTGNPALDAGVNAGLRTVENWDDTFRYSLGATYQANSQLTLRGGVAYDFSPVDDEYRTLRIPDGNRLWLSIGGSYALNENLKVDAGYSLIFVDKVKLGENDNGLIGTNSRGEGNIHLFALGLSGSF
ncbi:OmpP1/FadL family transporter [Roseibacillus persicicus]|uniref:OmpP1/FadL family transporter n=1 Tax=Roseibacillus persicicus TaxID=454148 RepID=UPI00280C55F2|nr:outer membrane protein transport protein [Roseibacillus persicicus]MDQ8189498.1 outer membrane protein transport protein [Roseibacillus persicicus]